MKFIQLNESCYYFNGAVNIGYIHHEQQGLLIDAGIDDSTMKKVLRQLEQDELPITHLFITHGHADHYGGAAYLQKKYSVHTMAPVFEEAILRNPMLEPLYLFGGNDPLPELRNKFLEGKPIQVDQVISEGTHQIDKFTFESIACPGHSYYQLAILMDDILFAGDGYFATDQLKKHKIPFLTDAEAAIQSLQRLKEITCKGALPGHGVYEENFQQTITENIAFHEEVIEAFKTYISSMDDGISHETFVADMCEHYEVNAPQLSQWLLFRTAITGYLLALIKREEVESVIEHAKWIFKGKENEET